MKNIRWIVFGLFVLTIALLYFSGIGKYLTIESLKAHRMYLDNVVHQDYAFSVLMFMVISAILTLTYLPVAIPLALMSGFLFKVFPGVLYVVVGSTVGATGMFFISRYFLGSFVQKRYSKRLKKFNEALEQNGANFLLMINFLSIIPFSILGTIAGLTKLTWFSFAWTTAVGFLPSAAIFAFAGQQLSRVNSFKDIISWKVMMLFILLALLAFVPILIKRYRYHDL